jgi:hypothetical protein
MREAFYILLNENIKNKVYEVRGRLSKKGTIHASISVCNSLLGQRVKLRLIE